MTARTFLAAAALAALILATGAPAMGAPNSGAFPEGDLPTYLRDRGTGVSTSMFGTYVRRGELLVYPFYEYTLNDDQEYKPAELGYAVEHDYRGNFVEHEALIFLAYGLGENVAVELESALYTSGRQRKAASDPSAMPTRFRESGFGDTQAELRWRWCHETATRPELWSYFELTFPFQRDRVLIGTQDWEFVQGFGLIKGFRWGTVTARVAAMYSESDKTLMFGEYALEYLKRLSPNLRWTMSVEGEEDEVAAIGELQWRIAPRAFLKLNNGFGITSKAPDLAPEVGILFSF